MWQTNAQNEKKRQTMKNICQSIPEKIKLNTTYSLIISENIHQLPISLCSKFYDNTDTWQILSAISYCNQFFQPID